jgi:hypothetical protein
VSSDNSARHKHKEKEHEHRPKTEHFDMEYTFDDRITSIEGMSDKYTNGLPKSLLTKISQLKNNPTKYNEFQRDIRKFNLQNFINFN